MHAKVSAPLNGLSRIDLIQRDIITDINPAGSYGKEIDPIRQNIFLVKIPFLFSTLINYQFVDNIA
jgi:hypothetical protein